MLTVRGSTGPVHRRRRPAYSTAIRCFVPGCGGRVTGRGSRLEHASGGWLALSGEPGLTGALGLIGETDMTGSAGGRSGQGRPAGRGSGQGRPAGGNKDGRAGAGRPRGE